MQVTLTEVTAENTFNNEFHAKFNGMGSQYREGGSYFTRGFAREYVIGQALGINLINKTLRIQDDYLTCTVGGEMGTKDFQHLLNTNFEVDGKVFAFDSIRAESYQEPYSEPSLGIEITYKCPSRAEIMADLETIAKADHSGSCYARQALDAIAALPR